MRQFTTRMRFPRAIMNSTYFTSRTLPLGLGLILLALMWPAGLTRAAADPDLSAESRIRPKADRPLTASAAQFLAQRDADSATVWVFLLTMLFSTSR